MFCTDRRGRRSLQICTIFLILVVGATIGRPSFIKVSLRFERTCTWQAASFLRKHCGRPYRFGCYPKFIVGRGGYCPLAFIKISFCLTRDHSISPKQKYPPVAYGWIFDFLIRISPCFPQLQQRELPQLQQRELPQQREPLPLLREPLQLQEPLPLLREQLPLLLRTCP